MFFGPLLGPIIGGFLIMSPLSWRATFWFCFALALSIFTFLFFLFPETYRQHDKYDLELPTTKDSISSASSGTLNRAEQSDSAVEKNETIDKSDEKTVTPVPVKRRIDPLAAFYLLRHPFIFLSAVISGIAFGCMFAVETIIPGLYETNYGFNSWQTGIHIFGMIFLLT